MWEWTYSCFGRFVDSRRCPFYDGVIAIGGCSSFKCAAAIGEVSIAITIHPRAPARYTMTTRSMFRTALGPMVCLLLVASIYGQNAVRPPQAVGTAPVPVSCAAGEETATAAANDRAQADSRWRATLGDVLSEQVAKGSVARCRAGDSAPLVQREPRRLQFAGAVALKMPVVRCWFPICAATVRARGG